MEQYLYLLLLLFSYTNVLGNPKYAKIDKESKSVPDSLKTSEKIAEFLTSKLQNEDEKAKSFIHMDHPQCAI